MSPLSPLPVLNLQNLMGYTPISASQTEVIILELLSFDFVSISSAKHLS